MLTPPSQDVPSLVADKYDLGWRHTSATFSLTGAPFADAWAQLSGVQSFKDLHYIILYPCSSWDSSSRRPAWSNISEDVSLSLLVCGASLYDWGGLLARRPLFLKDFNTDSLKFMA